MFNPQLGFHAYYVYILTNSYRSTFYIGVTNNLKIRLAQHNEDVKNNAKTFVGKYNLGFLVYYEKFNWIQEAIAREKELKKWRREKKLVLIRKTNPDFQFLNSLFD
jgi:putative endonuclease